MLFGDLTSQSELAPGSMRGLQLCVADAVVARAELVGRNVEASKVMTFDWVRPAADSARDRSL